MMKFTRTIKGFQAEVLTIENGEQVNKIVTVAESNENKAKKEIKKSFENCLILSMNEVSEKRTMSLDDFMKYSTIEE